VEREDEGAERIIGIHCAGGVIVNPFFFFLFYNPFFKA